MTGHCIPTKITLGNIYKPPEKRKKNLNISNLIDDITPILHVLGTENSNAVLVGDFNVDLLKLTERDKFYDLYDLFTTNGFFPKISVPTRFTTNTCSQIDQIYVKVPRAHYDISIKTTAGVIISNISDHLPCFTSINILQSKLIAPKKLQ